jgi:hypothetical protein
MSLIMRDPHVASLRYRLVLEEGVRYDYTPRNSHVSPTFDVVIEGMEVTVTPKTHHATAELARAEAEPFLSAWEVDAGLGAGRREFSFEFLRAEMVDRLPGAGGVTLSPIVRGHATLGMGVIRTGPFPTPPTDFAYSPDVDALWHRFVGYQKGREPLTSMAYFCWTVLKAAAGRDRAAAKRFAFSNSVVSTLKRLCAQGDVRTARKVVSQPQRALTGAEVRWLNAAVLAMIRRTGEHAADPAERRKEITLQDLPPL